MALPANERRLKDNAHIVSIALPNAANTVNTNVIDLNSNIPFVMTSRLTVQISTTQSTGANSKNINARLQDSNESNANFTNIAELGVKVIAGNAANYPSASANYVLPPTAKRYVRATATGEANGGDASDGTLTCQLLF